MTDGTIQPRFRFKPGIGDVKSLQRALLLGCAQLLSLFPFAATPLVGQTHRMEAQSSQNVETGVPLFSITSHEVMGLDSPPSDLQLLPDGRTAVLAGSQLAMGDGVRWSSFKRMLTDEVMPLASMAIDKDGSLYMAVRGGFGKIEFNAHGEWSVKPVAEWAKTQNAEIPVLQSVFTTEADWLWFGDSGPIISWRPGEKLSELGTINTLETLFRFRGKIYASDRTVGGLFRAEPGKLVPINQPSSVSINDTITCAAPRGSGAMLVGTYGNGLKLFDGSTLSNLPNNALGANCRINDLKSFAGSLYVAAIEGKGLALLDADGRLLQLLDKSLDHRLSSIRRLSVGANGIVWGLLNGALLRVEIPSRVSYFEPLTETGLATAQPSRLNGDLWVLMDGKATRGAYDTTGRLTDLYNDTPPNRFAYTFSTDAGLAITGTEAGAYFRTEAGWVPFANDTQNLRILDPAPRENRWVFGAEGKVGWLKPTQQGFEVESTEVPGLGPLFNSETDADATIWVEEGNARVASVRFANGKFEVAQYGKAEGLPEGWAQLFKIDEHVRVNTGGRIFSYSRANQRFEEDYNFDKAFPGVSNIVGRPGRDALGRVWISSNNRARLFEKREGIWVPVDELMPLGFLPYFFTFEADGVVWMHSKNHLARFDPQFPRAELSPYRALITHVTLPGSKRVLQHSGASLGPLTYSDNSIVVHFVTPNSPLGTSVNYEVKLEGADTNWVSAGTVGSAVFNSLKEGRYVVHVRPDVAGVHGDSAELAFTIEPPWFRSSGAYALYILAIAGVVVAGSRFSTFLQRRENTRLEHLVTQRTRELNETNERLESQVEEISLLNQAIEQSPVAVYITRPGGALVFANPRACEQSGYGISELIGESSKILRAESTSPETFALIESTVAQGNVWRGQLKNRKKDGHLFDVRVIIVPIRNYEHKVRHHLMLEEDISASVAEQEQRRRLESQLFQAQKLESLGTLAGGIAHDFNNILTGILGFCELARLSAGDREAVTKDLDEVASAGLRAKDLVAQILTFSRQTSAHLTPLDLALPVSEALKLVRASTPSTVVFTSHLEPTIIRADKTQIQQIVLNLCTNSAQAIKGHNGRVDVELKSFQVDARLAAELPSLTPGPYARLKIADDGCGMDAATLERIFDPFFTTKAQGEGTGLGLSIVQGIVASHNGAHRVRSTVGIGTQFELYFPLTTDPVHHPVSTPPIPQGNSQEVLVVDDEKTIASFMASRLRKMGYRAEVFYDSRQALDAVLAQPTRFDAIVTDLTMPGLTGADLVQRVREEGIQIPAIIVTGYGREAVRSKLETLSNCTVLPKPFGGDELARAIGEALPMK